MKEVKPIIEPIYQTSNYLLDGEEPNHGYTYSRSAQPNRDTLQGEIAKLENAKYCLCFSSGLAAVDAVMRLFKAGDEILCFDDLYGGSYRLFKEIHPDKTFTYGKDLKVGHNTEAVFFETLTNPTLQVVDVEIAAESTRKNSLLLIVDNTFATPHYLKPLNLGADIVIHSVSKYLNGHGDVVMGAVCLNNKEIYDKLSLIQRMCGAIPGPFDCWLVSRGLKTFGLRMDKITENANKVFDYLRTHPRVRNVNYRGFGGAISFDLKKDTEKEALRVCNATKIFKFAVSLGGLTSLITHCASTNNAVMTAKHRRWIGVSDSLIRLGVGLEDADELIADLNGALIPSPLVHPYSKTDKT